MDKSDSTHCRRCWIPDQVRDDEGVSRDDDAPIRHSGEGRNPS